MKTQQKTISNSLRVSRMEKIAPKRNARVVLTEDMSGGTHGDCSLSCIEKLLLALVNCAERFGVRTLGNTEHSVAQVFFFLSKGKSWERIRRAAQ